MSCACFIEAATQELPTQKTRQTERRRSTSKTCRPVDMLEPLDGICLSCCPKNSWVQLGQSKPETRRGGKDAFNHANCLLGLAQLFLTPCKWVCAKNPKWLVLPLSFKTTLKRLPSKTHTASPKCAAGRKYSRAVCLLLAGTLFRALLIHLGHRWGTNEKVLY